MANVWTRERPWLTATYFAFSESALVGPLPAGYAWLVLRIDPWAVLTIWLVASLLVTALYKRRVDALFDVQAALHESAPSTSAPLPDGTTGTADFASAERRVIWGAGSEDVGFAGVFLGLITALAVMMIECAVLVGGSSLGMGDRVGAVVLLVMALGLGGLGIGMVVMARRGWKGQPDPRSDLRRYAASGRTDVDALARAADALRPMVDALRPASPPPILAPSEKRSRAALIWVTCLSGAGAIALIVWAAWTSS